MPVVTMPGYIRPLQGLGFLKKVKAKQAALSRPAASTSGSTPLTKIDALIAQVKRDMDAARATAAAPVQSSFSGGRKVFGRKTLTAKQKADAAKQASQLEQTLSDLREQRMLLIIDAHKAPSTVEIDWDAPASQQPGVDTSPAPNLQTQDPSHAHQPTVPRTTGIPTKTLVGGGLVALAVAAGFILMD